MALERFVERSGGSVYKSTFFCTPEVDPFEKREREGVMDWEVGREKCERVAVLQRAIGVYRRVRESERIVI